jgi:hypothetical protein
MSELRRGYRSDVYGTGFTDPDILLATARAQLYRCGRYYVWVFSDDDGWVHTDAYSMAANRACDKLATAAARNAGI